ncbi:ComF family protein [Brevundimonas sp.]|uniref:ComF family protein n=1 Tax=Brevundimonas sp. TaxID=1871086 RepID=UPI0035B2B2CD
MRRQNGVWATRMEGAAAMAASSAALAGRRAREAGRGLADAVFPPVSWDDASPSAGAGLTVDSWSRVTFLEDPVCDGCGAGFEHDGGAFASDRCLACQAKPYRFARCRAACVYDEHSRDLILKFKHGDDQVFALQFAQWLRRSAADLLAEADAVAPVPLHRLRLLGRRFNQAAEIARPLARSGGLEYLPDVLIRPRATDSQGGKSLRGRRENVRTAFAVSDTGRRRIKGRRILLIDDVLTTGATAEACAKALLDAGARAVDLAVVARVRAAREFTG